LDIINSNHFFNLISNGKEELTPEDLISEINDSTKIGAERYLIKIEEKFVGIVEFLMRNPNDEFPWLGLLVIKKEFHNQGYAAQALNEV
jgi:RimJ/RimL family protein N-acetyltransferase